MTNDELLGILLLLYRASVHGDYNYLEMAFHLIIGQSIHLHQLADLLRGRHFCKQETSIIRL